METKAWIKAYQRARAIARINYQIPNDDLPVKEINTRAAKLATDSSELATHYGDLIAEQLQRHRYALKFYNRLKKAA